MSKKRDPIFIVGNSRSGTTMMARLLNEHRDICILNETHCFDEFPELYQQEGVLPQALIPRMVERLLATVQHGYYRRREEHFDTQQSMQIQACYSQMPFKDGRSLLQCFFKEMAGRHGKSLAGDQTPRHVFFVKEILRLFPDARIIHMVRDPRGVLLSQKNKWRACRDFQQPRFEVVRTWFNYHPITLSMLWNRCVDAGLTGAELATPERMHTVVFDDLVQDPETHVREVFRFLNVEFEPRALAISVEMSSNLRQEGGVGISKEVSDNWRMFLSPTEIFLAERICASNMAKFGFSRSGIRPSFLYLFYFVIGFPVHVMIAFMLNFLRMGNPLRYFARRLFPGVKK